jgi:glutathione S-transferase
MKLYYSPGACSLASHIALEEAGADYETVRVDLGEHKTEKGEDFYAISRRGYVPALETSDGLLTENPAVLTYIADQTGTAPSGADRYRMLEWIGFTGSEVHKAFKPLFMASKAGDASGVEAAKPEIAKKLALAAELLDGRDWVVGKGPTVADNYLFVITLWATKFDVPMPDSLQAYRARNLARGSVQKAMKAEGLA